MQEHFGSKIADLRNAAGLSLKQLGDRIGMKKEFIHRVEKGKTKPTISTLSRILDGLGYDISIEFVKKC